MEIQETRQDISKKLDELEQDILDELSSIYTKHNSEIEELITDLKSRKQPFGTGISVGLRNPYYLFESSILFEC
jgi:peptidoglycan hydrolase CwlO-like protein